MRAVVTVLAIWLAGLGSAAQFGKLSVAFDLMAARYPEQGAAGIGLIVSIVGIVGLIFGTTAGLLVARIGPRRAGSIDPSQQRTRTHVCQQGAPGP